jgi:hypothetical protein
VTVTVTVTVQQYICQNQILMQCHQISGSRFYLLMCRPMSSQKCSQKVVICSMMYTSYSSQFIARISPVSRRLRLHTTTLRVHTPTTHHRLSLSSSHNHCTFTKTRHLKHCQNPTRRHTVRRPRLALNITTIVCQTRLSTTSYSHNNIKRNMSSSSSSSSSSSDQKQQPLVFVTGNAGKLREVKAMLGDVVADLVSRKVDCKCLWRCLCVCVCVSLSLCVCAPLCVCVSLRLCVSASLCVSLRLSSSLCVSLRLSASLCISLRLSASLCISLRLSALCISLRLSALCISLRLSALCISLRLSASLCVSLRLSASVSLSDSCVAYPTAWLAPHSSLFAQWFFANVCCCCCCCDDICVLLH